jgi:hypothetical protein
MDWLTDAVSCFMDSMTQKLDDPMTR